jgi:hypothetical protein
MAATGLLLAGCGSSPVTPTPPPVVTVTVTSIVPARGATNGTTELTVTGTNFVAGATVNIGGVAATNVRVQSATTILATAGPHDAGVVSVEVAAGGKQGTLANAFTYVVPAASDIPVVAIKVQGTFPNDPATINLSDEAVVTAVFTPSDTPTGPLTFEWSAPVGIFTGTGPSVRWRPPQPMTTPADVTLTVKVGKSIEVAVPTASSISVTATASVRVHDSLKEAADYAVQFLLDFSDSKLSPEYTVRNFWDGCPGKNDELGDVRTNRALFEIKSYRVSAPSATSLNFGGRCAFRYTRGDACVAVPVEWHSLRYSTGLMETAIGVDHLTAVYRSKRWWLCDSGFEGTSSSPAWLPRFKR